MGTTRAKVRQIGLSIQWSVDTITVSGKWQKFDAGDTRIKCELFQMRKMASKRRSKLSVCTATFARKLLRALPRFEIISAASTRNTRCQPLMFRSLQTTRTRSVLETNAVFFSLTLSAHTTAKGDWKNAESHFCNFLGCTETSVSRLIRYSCFTSLCQRHECLLCEDDAATSFAFRSNLYEHVRKVHAEKGLTQNILHFGMEFVATDYESGVT